MTTIDRSNDGSDHTRLPWARVVDLAKELESQLASGLQIDNQIAARLARAVLCFQEQLLGGAVKTSRGR